MYCSRAALPLLLTLIVLLFPISLHAQRPLSPGDVGSTARVLVPADSRSVVVGELAGVTPDSLYVLTGGAFPVVRGFLREDVLRVDVRGGPRVMRGARVGAYRGALVGLALAAVIAPALASVNPEEGLMAVSVSVASGSMYGGVIGALVGWMSWQPTSPR